MIKPKQSFSLLSHKPTIDNNQRNYSLNQSSTPDNLSYDLKPNMKISYSVKTLNKRRNLKGSMKSLDFGSKINYLNISS